MDRKKFARRLRELRGKTDCSVISELCGMSTSSYRRYENGEFIPSAKSLELIADYFDVSVDYLLCRTDDKKSHK